MGGQLAGKVALVTGGASGIGRACGLAFAREGAKVVIADRRIEEGEETVEMIKARGGTAIFVKTDVSKPVEVKALVEKTVKSYGRLDCACNNAGVEGINTLTADYPEEEWDRVIDINLKSVWLCMKYQIPWMLRQQGGVIVNMASVAGLTTLRYNAPYAASKHGVVGLTKTAALEYAQAGIRINAVCPGTTRTPMIARITAGDPAVEAQLAAEAPMGRMGTPAEIAEVVVWLCSDAASYVTGHTMVVDGGKMVA